MQTRTEQAAYAFYRVILLGCFGVILIAFGENILRAIGFGLLALMIVLHMTSIATWVRGDIIEAVKTGAIIEEKK